MNIIKGSTVNISTFRGVVKDTVLSVGGKYITTNGYKFHRSTLRQVDPRGCAAYIIEDIEEYYIERERKVMLGEIRCFDLNKLNLEDASSIVNILDKYKHNDLEPSEDQEGFEQLLLQVQ